MLNHQSLIAVEGGFEIKRFPGEIWLLWKFLLQLLLLPNRFGHIIQWTFLNDWEFSINDHKKLIDLWMVAKNRRKMKDDSLLRSLRYYYQKEILIKHANEKESLYLFNPKGPILNVLGVEIVQSPMKLEAIYQLHAQCVQNKWLQQSSFQIEQTKPTTRTMAGESVNCEDHHHYSTDDSEE